MRIKFPMLCSLLLFFIATVTGICGEATAVPKAPPGAAEEATMKAAAQTAEQLQKEIALALKTLATDAKEVSLQQKKIGALTTEMTQVNANLQKSLDASEEYRKLQAERAAAEKKFAEASNADKQKMGKEASATRYRYTVQADALRTKLFPAEAARLKSLESQLSLANKQMFRAALQELRNDPAIGEKIQALLKAEAQKEEASAAMLKARGEVTPVGFLQQQPRPLFKEGHTLPPLTRYGWALPFELRKAFADHWGYAVELGGYVTPDTAESIRNAPDSDDARAVALAKSDPKKYKLSAICARYTPQTFPAGTWTLDAQGRPLNAKAQSMDGTEWNDVRGGVISPLAPDAFWQACAQGRADPLREIRKEVPLSIVLNGGEYGIGVLGFAMEPWAKDPRIVKAAEALGSGLDGWFALVSKNKGREEMIIAEAVRAAVPDRELYIHYTTPGVGFRNDPSVNWRLWCYDFKYMAPASDLPSDEHYADHFNTGWAGNRDILTLALNSVGYQIELGRPLAYSWFWCKKLEKENMRLYLGFLKCIYVMGTIGGNAGMYELPKFKEPFKPENPPYWMTQAITLGKAHALFSHLEDYLRNGTLLPGEYKHFWSFDQPAYELLPQELAALRDDPKQTPFINKSKTTGKDLKPEEKPTKDTITVLRAGRPVRVLARKHKSKAEWLVVAWAADGNARNITVNIPGAGAAHLRARDVGSVYLVQPGEGAAKATLLDSNEENPSLSFSAK